MGQTGLKERRGLALELYDCSYALQREIGEIMVESGFAKREIGEKVVYGEEPGQFYTKYVKDRKGPGKRASQKDWEASLASGLKDGSNLPQYEDLLAQQEGRLLFQHPASRLEDGSNPVRADNSIIQGEGTEYLGKLGKIRRASMLSRKAETTDTSLK